MTMIKIKHGLHAHHKVLYSQVMISWYKSAVFRQMQHNRKKPPQININVFEQVQKKLH